MHAHRQANNAGAFAHRCLSIRKFKRADSIGLTRRESASYHYGVISALTFGEPKMMLRKFVFAAVTMTFALGLLAGCNTVKGVGKDIEHGGQRLQEVTER